MTFRATFIASTLFAATVATASPKVSGDDRRVVVDVSHAEWTGAPARSMGDAVEISLAAGAEASRVDFDDRTVKRVSVGNGNSPSLFIRLHHSKSSTERTAEQLKIEKIAGGLRVSFPREPVKTETTTDAKPATVAKAEAPKTNVPKVEEKPALVVTTVVAGLTATPTRADSRRAIPVATDNKAKQNPAPSAAATYAEQPASGARMWSTLLLICLAAAGGLTMLFRRKNGSGVKEEIFRVLGAHNLGGKSKLVLVDVQDRKFLLSIDDKATTVVGSWTGDAKPSAMDTGSTQMGVAIFDENEDAEDEHPLYQRPAVDDDIPARPRHQMLSGSSSPAVAGLMKLRERHSLSEEVQSGDLQADDEWAGMLLRATNKRAHS